MVVVWLATHSQPDTQLPSSPGCFSFPGLAQSPATTPHPQRVPKEHSVVWSKQHYFSPAQGPAPS